MKTITLKSRKLTPAIARQMEQRGLVTFIRHPAPEVRRTLRKDFFKGPDFRAAIHGFHSVTITYTDIFLSSHPAGQDEIVFLWDAEKNARPLYFVFALHKRQEYVRRLKAGTLTTKDYLALRIPLNDARFSSFIVHHGAVHCELTDNSSPGTLAPSFFVLEPVRLAVRYTEERTHGLELLLEP